MITKPQGPASIYKTGYYKGWKLRVNNSSKCPYLRTNRRDRILEYNPEFFARLNDQQEYWLLEWAIRNRIIRNPYECDIKTKKLFLSKGYDINTIYDLYQSMKFNNRHDRASRMENLFFGKPAKPHTIATIYYSITDFFFKLFNGRYAKRS